MNSFSPIAGGFRLVFRRPAIPLGEIAWRWSFVASSWVLALVFAVEFIDSLPVSALDRLLLATRQPIFIARAIRRMFHGTLLRFTGGAVVLGIGLAIAWILLASFGRTATLGSLLDDLGVGRSSPGWRFFPSIMSLNLIRVAVTLAALVGSIGTALIASAFWAASHISASDATRVFVLGLFLVWLAWCVLNWLLSTAAIPLLIDGKSVLGSIGSTLQVCLQLCGPVLATGAFFLLLHIAALVAACGIGFVILGTVGALGPGPTLFLEATVATAYCAIADFLYTARMAAYVYVIQEAVTPKLVRPIRPPILPADNFSHIDQSELILSDVPAASV